MPYYRGDGYYGGSSYYRGDPFIGALIGGALKLPGVGNVLKKGLGWVGNRITGSGIKKAVGATVGALAAGAATAAVTRLTQPSMPELMPIEMGGTPGGISATATMSPPGGGGTQWVVTPSGRRMRVRWSQSKGKWVAVRNMNPLNPKALNRALRRATGFEKFAKRTVTALYRTSAGTTKQRKFKRK